MRTFTCFRWVTACALVNFQLCDHHYGVAVDISIVTIVHTASFVAIAESTKGGVRRYHYQQYVRETTQKRTYFLLACLLALLQ